MSSSESNQLVRNDKLSRLSWHGYIGQLEVFKDGQIPEKV
jgi:hypothetical protein